MPSSEGCGIKSGARPKIGVGFGKRLTNIKKTKQQISIKEAGNEGKFIHTKKRKGAKKGRVKAGH